MKFRFGVCTDPTRAALVHSLGGVAIEPPFVICARQSDADFCAARDTLLASPLRAYSMNSMLPGDFVLYGNEEQSRAVCDFVRRGMERAAQMGVGSVCMGSGTARSIPDGMTREEAADRLSALMARFCEIAAPYGIRVAIEPLRAFETNFIHTMDDAYDIIRRVPECKNLGINPDMFHMLEGGEPFSHLIQYRDYVTNVHIAEPETRTYPRPENLEAEAKYIEFLTALRDSDYNGIVSIEALTKDFAADVSVALPYLQSLAEAIEHKV